jgi:hypothetical protein
MSEPMLPDPGWPARCRAALRAYGVPDHVREGLELYLVHHVPTGGAVRAILENDLTQTFNRADPATLAGLVPIVAFLIHEAPAEAWGSPALVRAWLGAAPARAEEAAL